MIPPAHGQEGWGYSSLAFPKCSTGSDDHFKFNARARGENANMYRVSECIHVL